MSESRRVAVIVDDEPDIRSLVERVLIQCGFETVSVSNGKDAVEAVRHHQPMLTTLDVSMPGMDGFTAAQLIREISTTYIIMLTALDDEIDVVQGLGAGADDYLVKPFRPRELRARVESFVRRYGYGAEPVVAADPVPAPTQAPAPAQPPVQHVPAQQSSPPVVRTVEAPGEPGTQPATHPDVHEEVAPLRHDGIEMDVEAHIVHVDGAVVELTPSEFELLAALLRSGRRVRSKADLVLSLRGESYVTHYYVTDADKRAIEVHMANLRRKIGDDSSTPRWIETVRGVGYRLTSV
ncbi:response regulator transcription factor [Nocardioides terrisoli]|uniref:response regulator transcription factor n=1 Tax=Nocardioides terrisoli TaxID=3388267 RepID=UPI00287B9438|nr:response regulator transcription factor [Nocardioides marmorisolisilvae]